MSMFKRMMSALLVLAMVFAMAACGGNEVTPEEPTAAPTAEQVTYTVTLRTKGGMAMSAIDIYVYADSSLTDLKGYGQTNEEGVATFRLAKAADYAIVVSGAPKGYQVEPSYAFSGTSAVIELASQLVTDESLAGAKLGPGDVMYDFTVTTPAGETVTLSEMLSRKKMVLLNFWYTTCTYCIAEFPYMQEAYEMYGEDVGIIAVDPLDGEGDVSTFQSQHGLTFPMATCPATWAAAFDVQGYPTSVVIDRYGVICLIEAGGITSLRPFVSMFEYFTADDYEQKIITALDEIVTRVLPTHEMGSSEELASVLNSGEIQVSYRADDDEYSWPFIITEKQGESCVKASNQQIDDSWSILVADVELKAGQAIGFDYLVSSEAGSDLMHVIVNDEPIYAISGVNEEEVWETCYPWVAETDGTYQIVLTYIKDGSTSAGDDTVYIKDVRVVDPSQISTETYIPRYAAISEDGFDYRYVDIVLNETDGFYHVGTVDGPLLLADLMGMTRFNEDRSVWSMVDEGLIVLNGHNYYEELVDYCSLASRSQLDGVTPVTEELAQYLKIVAQIAGFEDDENEWLKICKYYESYGGNGTQLVNPILGLEDFCPLTATEGKNVPTNYFYYDRALLPRGKVAEFVPTRSGAYRITSRANSVGGVEGWLFYDSIDKEKPDHVFEGGERMFSDSENVSMVVYMEKGRTYYIDICFWDMYETGYIYYDIEYIGATHDLFTACAPGYFTYDTNATGDAMYYLITGGIDVVLGEDGKYYEDLGLDANGNQRYGSLIYVDFTGITSVFSTPVATVPAYNADGTLAKDENGESIMITGMIDKGGFDFSKSENDMYILSFMQEHDNDPDATDAYLRELWGADYDAYAEIYQLEDVYAGRYHGEAGDLTEEMRTYLDDIITTGSVERQGCVVVTERLAEILQMLMDKYTFENVENAWLKMCYYYDHLAPEN